MVSWKTLLICKCVLLDVTIGETIVVGFFKGFHQIKELKLNF